MRETPSIKKAKEEALERSITYPKVEWYIIYKSGKKPLIMSETCYFHDTYIQSFFEDGYITVCKFIGGEEIPAEKFI